MDLAFDIISQEDRVKRKHLVVNRETHRRFMDMKLRLGFKNAAELLNYLMDKAELLD